MLSARVGLVGELLRVLFLVPPRSVNGVVPKVEKERFILMVFDETNCFIRQAVGNVFAFRAISDGSDVMFRTGLSTFVDAVRREIASRAGTWLGVERNFESVLLGPVFLAQSEVPFPKMASPITSVAQHFGQRIEIGIKITLADRIDELLVG